MILIAERINYKTIVRSAILANRSIKSFIICAICYKSSILLEIGFSEFSVYSFFFPNILARRISDSLSLSSPSTINHHHNLYKDAGVFFSFPISLRHRRKISSPPSIRCFIVCCFSHDCETLSSCMMHTRTTANKIV